MKKKTSGNNLTYCLLPDYFVNLPADIIHNCHKKKKKIQNICIKNTLMRKKILL